MKPIWHSYLVLNLGNCAHETPAETGLISCLAVKRSCSSQRSALPPMKNVRPCLDAKFIIPNYLAAHVWIIKSRQNKKLIA